MLKECPNCQFKGKPKFIPTNSFGLPIAGFLLGIFFYWLADYPHINRGISLWVFLVFLAIALIPVLFLLVNYYYKNHNSCPRCEYGKMTDLDLSEES